MKNAARASRTPAFDAWIDAERRAAEAERLLRESRHRGARRRERIMDDPEMAARAAHLKQEAEALFAEAIREMDGAVDAALQRAHSRLH